MFSCCKHSSVPAVIKWFRDDLACGEGASTPESVPLCSGWKGICILMANHGPGEPPALDHLQSVGQNGHSVPGGHRHNFGALLVGLFDGQRLRFTGRVGTGYSEDVLSDLAKRMAPLRTPNCPFEPPPKVRTATWIYPTLVAQIAFAEWTDDEKLRQPVFLGVRDDIKPNECQ
jgi:hypothetical protein